MTMKARLSVGQRVRIERSVTRSVWGAPCGWGGAEGVIVGGGGRVQGMQIYAVVADGCEISSDFADCVLQPAEVANG